MKRTKPLRRTPLKRSVKTIRRVSKKRAKDMKTYALLREAFLEAYHWCYVSLFVRDQKIPSTEIHHVCGRTGTNYLDTDTWIAVSRDGHNWIHSHPSKAREMGWLK